jgi:hypothetical protein
LDESAALSLSFNAFASSETVKKSSETKEDRSLTDELTEPPLEFETERKCEMTTWDREMEMDSNARSMTCKSVS